MRKTILVLLLTISLCANSQKHYIGVKGGANWNNTVETNLNINYDDVNYSLGFVAGLTYDYFISDLFSISTEILYFQRGHMLIWEVYFVNDAGQGRYVDVNNIYNYNYASIPMKICLNTDFLFLNVGVINSYLLNSTIKTEFDNMTNTIENTGNINKFDLAGVVGLGITSHITDVMLFYTSFSYHRSFTNVEEIIFDSSFKSYGLLWSVGLKYDLTK